MMLEVRPGGMRPMVQAFAEADLREVLPRIQVPTLLLYGDADRRSPPEVVARDLHAKIPGSRLLVMPGVGHQCDMEASERVPHGNTLRQLNLQDPFRSGCHPVLRGTEYRRL